jgi:6-phosphogluconolactonase
MRLSVIAVSLIFTCVTLMSPSNASAAPDHSGQTNYFLYVGSYGKGVQAYRFSAGDGKLQPVGLAGKVDAPSFLAADPQFRFLYAVSEESSKPGGVAAFAIDRETGSLRALNSTSSGGVSPCHLAVDKTGKMVMVANYTTGGVSAYPILQDGRLGDMSPLMTVQGHSADSKRQSGPHAHQVVISADNRFAYVPDLGLDHIRIYKLDPSTATLTPGNPPFAQQDPGMGPRHMVFSPDENFAYVMNELKSEVSVFRHDKSTGSLAKVQDVSSLPAGYSGENGPAEILIDAAGNYIYATNRGHDSIAVFWVDKGSGTLKQIQVISSEGKAPRGLAIDPTGKFMFAGNQDTNNFVVFHIEANGQLKPTGRVVNMPTPVAFLFVPVK